MEAVSKPWAWYVVGPLIGLSVPLLLWLGNKRLNVSASLRHICAALFSRNFSFLQSNWLDELWSLYFVNGIVIGGWIGGFLLYSPDPSALHPDTVGYLRGLGISNFTGIAPSDLFGWGESFSWRGFSLLALGGFFMGVGSRYARGSLSGHSLLGVASLQWPSFVFAICSYVSALLCARLLLPWLLVV